MLFRTKSGNEPSDPRVTDFGSTDGVDQTIARLNIEHFRKLLMEEKDETKLNVIHRLLAEEEAKLASLDRPSGPKQRGD